jgi:putative ABC transport system permease protein
MIAFKLAFRNLMGAGLRTWLNVAVLSFAFLIIIFYNGMIDGWNRQSRTDTKDWETGKGQFWLPGYDRYDPFTIRDSHSPLSDEINKEISAKTLTPVLIAEGTAYPQGRMMGVILKGVDPGQTVLKLPTSLLKSEDGTDYAIIGRRMAESAKLNEGDRVLVRWRDKNGTFDAREIQIAAVFRCDVPVVDKGQIYLRLDVLQKMMGVENEATILVAGEKFNNHEINGWIFRDTGYLLADMDKIIQAKKAGGVIIQGLLLIIALLAIFDTQVLSIFRRQKEIGTYIAMGMTRTQVVGIFTVEGAAHSLLATIFGALYGIPLFMLIDKAGISMKAAQVSDLPITEKIYPYYSFQLIVYTVILVIITATVVSYLPARKISKMKPTEALKGKIQ